MSGFSSLKQGTASASWSSWETEQGNMHPGWNTWHVADSWPQMVTTVLQCCHHSLARLCPISFGHDLGTPFCLPAQTIDKDQHGLLLVLPEVEKAVYSGLMRGTGSHFANYRKQQRSMTIHLYCESNLTRQTFTLCEPRPLWGKSRAPDQEGRQQGRYQRMKTGTLDPVRTRKPPLGQGLHQFPVERG